MNHERSIELIHADLDGEISAEDQQELHACLESDASLGALRDDMRKLHDVLGRVESEDPPPGLRSRIIAAAAPQFTRRIVKPRRSILASILPGWPAPALLRYGAAAAFGAAIVAVGLKVGDLDSHGPADPGSLVGTMTSYRAPGAATGRIALDTAAITGSVGTSVQNGLVVVDFNLSAAEPVEIIADYGQSGLSFSGFAQFEEASASVEADQGRVRFTQQDAHRYAVFFSPSGQGNGTIEFQFLADGKLIHEDALEVPAKGRN